jgi:hypothetical protein
MLAISAAMPAHADDYLVLTQDAFCLGVANYNVELLSRQSLPSANDANRTARYRAILNGAVKLQKIDADTVSGLVAAGAADASLCNNEQEKCGNQMNTDKSATPQQLESKYNTCMMFGGNDACKRVEACP